MEITLKEVTSKKELKEFIYLPERIHEGHETWIHPLYMDERKYYLPKKNEAYSYSDTILMLAYKEGQAVGRVMGIINNRYNEQRNEKTARFAFLETYDDKNVVKSLLDHVENWARKKGMNRVIGPYGFTDQDPEGFHIEGFEYRATFMTYANFDWMPRYVEELGYAKDVDYYQYLIQVPDELPELYHKVQQRVLRKGIYKLVTVKKKKDIKPWIIPALSLMNECYTESNIYGFTHLTENEMRDLAKKYMFILDPRLLKIVTAGDELVGFMVGIPDMTEGIKKAKGKLFPFGFLKILKSAKKTELLQLLIGSIKPGHRGRGIDALMGVDMIKSAHAAGFKVIDTHHELESNVKVRGEMLRAGGELYKKFRVYQKDV